jgi:hypothetical protein
MIVFYEIKFDGYPLRTGSLSTNFASISFDFRRIF